MMIIKAGHIDWIMEKKIYNHYLFRQRNEIDKSVMFKIFNNSCEIKLLKNVSDQFFVIEKKLEEFEEKKYVTCSKHYRILFYDRMKFYYSRALKFK